MESFKTGKNGYIRAVCCIDDQETWVLHDGSNVISRVNRKGQETACYDLGIPPHDAVLTKTGDILFSTIENSQVKKLGANGIISEFADLAPFRTRGLCLTDDNEVFVCLSHPTTKGDNKVVKLSQTGKLLQEIQKDLNGKQLFYDPCRAVFLKNDVLVVTDWLEDKNVVVSVSIKDSVQHLSTWDGHINGKEIERFRPVGITRTRNGSVLMADLFNAQVYKMEKNNTVTVLVQDVSIAPLGMCVDGKDQLWLGCDEGTINIIQM